MTLFPKRVCCVPEDRLEMRAAGASEKNGISGYVVRSGGRGPADPPGSRVGSEKTWKSR